MNSQCTTREATAADLREFCDYLSSHVGDNGVGATPLFLPIARGACLPTATLERFHKGLETALSTPGWVRLWLALDGGRIVAHCDLAAPRSVHALHRANLGLGVELDYRRRGLASRLLGVALAWAESDASLAWVDLDVLGTNVPARCLYERSGFELVGTVRDAFVVDGGSVDRIMMTRCVR